MSNYKFPLVDDKGKLFDRLPLIVLYLSNGEKIESNYFTKYASTYKPTRYMVDNGFIPKVEYHTCFISPQWTCKEFLKLVNEEIKKEHVVQVSNDSFIMMSNVCKIEVLVGEGDIICYGIGEWDNKNFISSEEPYIANENDIELDIESDKEIEKFNIDAWVENLNINK